MACDGRKGQFVRDVVPGFEVFRTLACIVVAGISVIVEVPVFTALIRFGLREAAGNSGGPVDQIGLGGFVLKISGAQPFLALSSWAMTGRKVCSVQVTRSFEWPMPIPLSHKLLVQTV